MADTIAVMNDGRIEQAGSATDLYERPRTEFVANFLGVSNLVDAQMRSADGGLTRVETHDGARACTCPPTAAARTDGGDVRVGVRPEKITLVPAGQDAPSGSATCCAGTVDRGRVPRRLDPVRDPRGRRRGADRDRPERRRRRAGRRSRPAARSSSPGTRSTPSSSPGSRRVPHDPRLERALEEMFTAERLSRRRFIGRAGSTGLALTGLSTLLAACGGDRGHRRAGGAGAEGPARGQPPEDRDRQLDVLELAALHRQEGHQGLQPRVRRQVQVRRGDQRQQRVLRQDPPAARAGPADRARHHHADRLPGGAARAAQLRRAARQEEHPERGEPGRQPQVDQLRPEPRLLDAVAVGRDRPGLQHQEDRPRAQERQGPLRPEVQGPRDDARASPTTRPTRCCSATASTPRRRRSTRSSARSRRSTRPTTRARSAASPATTTRPTSRRATCGVALAYSGDLIQLQSDNPDLRFAYPGGGRDALHRQHDDARQGASTRTRAETMMNYVYEPEVAAVICAYVNYITPGQGRQGDPRQDRPGAGRERADLPAATTSPPTCIPTPRCRPSDERADAGGDGAGDGA